MNSKRDSREIKERNKERNNVLMKRKSANEIKA